MDKIRVFIGAGPAQRVPAAVLRHTMLKNTRAPCDVQILSDLNVSYPRPKNHANRPRTPFSFQRFAIPKLCGYVGRAIYLDSDMIVLDDIAKLWDAEMGQAPVVLATAVEPSARNAVLLIDCERAVEWDWDLVKIVKNLDRGEMNYKSLMEDLSGLGPVQRTLDARWNRLDEMDEDTAILHFTDMRRQPWLAAGHPHEAAWMKALAEALAKPKESRLTGFMIREAEQARHIRMGLFLLSAGRRREAVS